eukprot:TRINITY_DN3787_c0_g1_i13.p1 TRINITY_DN3787_c0_g1~~TRINITY_DN3787_c0_g1_i13.p1  ORF type:complete len:192 (-),score=54.17 TRINITY_DN3787_c0_g1_i13:57-632(-)
MLEMEIYRNFVATYKKPKKQLTGKKLEEQFKQTLDSDLVPFYVNYFLEHSKIDIPSLKALFINSRTNNSVTSPTLTTTTTTSLPSPKSSPSTTPNATPEIGSPASTSLLSSVPDLTTGGTTHPSQEGEKSLFVPTEEGTQHAKKKEGKRHTANEARDSPRDGRDNTRRKKSPERQKRLLKSPGPENRSDTK